jgi:beta-alanine--pyruvate transaminase
LDANGAVPMGGVLVRDTVYESLAQGPEAAVELAHGYTYSGHPLACAAALATLDCYLEEGLFERAKQLAPVWEDALHSLRGKPHVRDIRNLGLLGAVEIESPSETPGQRARKCADICCDRGVFVRALGDTLVLSPPLIIDERQIGEIRDAIATGLVEAARH